MAREKKGKVVEIKPKNELVFPAGDPRNDMSPGEIMAFAREEEETIERHLKMMAKNAPPPSLVEEDDEDDEDVEDYEVDLEKGVVTQTVASGVLMKPKENVIKLDVDGNAVARALEPFLEHATAIASFNPYISILSDTFVHKSINKLVNELNDYEQVLRETSLKSPTRETGALLQQQAELQYEMSKELRKALVHFPGLGVHFDKIPEWAKARIESDMHKYAHQLSQLLD